MRRFLGTIIVAGTLAATASGAAAHVTVNPGEAEQGGFAKLTFRAPTERDVPTTQIEIDFPDEYPLPFVSVQPVPGWDYEVQRRTLDEPIDAFGEPVSEVVDRIIWSGGEVLPGEFQEFSVSVGPLPEADQLIFNALQTYEGGEVVRWIEPTPAGGEEPEFPAPVLTLIPAAGEGETPTTTQDSATTAESTGTTAAAVSDGNREDDDDSDGNGLALVALIVAIVGTALGAAALFRKRS